MPQRYPLHSITIRQALPQDAAIAGYVHALSLAQKRHFKTVDNDGVIQRAVQTEFFRQDMADGNVIFLASIPVFDVRFPCLHDNLASYAGFVALYPNERTLGLGWLYTTQSSYPVGPALLKHSITYAEENDFKIINLNAAYEDSAEFFTQWGGFTQDKPDSRKTGLMSLYRNDFKSIIHHIDQQSDPAFDGKIGKTLDSGPAFP